MPVTRCMNEIEGKDEYHITTARFDISESIYMSFWADTEEEAIAFFDGIAAKPDLAWERMALHLVPITEVVRPGKIVKAVRGQED